LKEICLNFWKNKICSVLFTIYKKCYASYCVFWFRKIDYAALVFVMQRMGYRWIHNVAM